MMHRGVGKRGKRGKTIGSDPENGKPQGSRSANEKLKVMRCSQVET